MALPSMLFPGSADPLIPMKRLLAALAPALLALGCGKGDSARPNVILITLDTTRADFVSCYGVHPGVTPNLDKLAAQGTRFDMAISTAGVTPVSHASILTGMNNHTHQLRVLSAPSGFTLPEDVPTLATTLARNGYHTAAVHSAFPVSRNFGFQRGFEVFEDLNTEMKHLTNDKGQVKSIWDVQNFQRRSDETTDLVEKSLKGEEPFFLWIHYWDPHDWDKLPPEELLSPKEHFFDAAAAGCRASSSTRRNCATKTSRSADSSPASSRAVSWRTRSSSSRPTTVRD